MRPDISFDEGALARRGLCLGKAHVRAAKRFVMYLYSSRRLGISSRRPSNSDEKNVTVIYEGAGHPLDNGLISGVSQFDPFLNLAHFFHTRTCLKSIAFIYLSLVPWNY